MPLEEPLLMRRNARIDRLLQSFLGVGTCPTRGQDCSPGRYGPASRAARIGERPPARPRRATYGGSSNLVSGQMNLSDGLPLPGVSYLRLRHEADDLMVTSVFGSRRPRASMIGAAGPSEWLSATGPDLIAVHAVN